MAADRDRDRERGELTPEAIASDARIAGYRGDVELAVRSEAAKLDRAKARLDLWEVAEERAFENLRFDIKAADADERAKRAALGLAKAEEERLGKQTEKGDAIFKLYAPCDGPVVHANNPYRPEAPPIIKVGATVRERQILFQVPDVHSPIRVNAAVHEPLVDRIKKGQRARITANALPGVPIVGAVESVAPLPDQGLHRQAREIIYPTMIRIEDAPEGLKPGMKVKVDILEDDRAQAPAP